MAKAIWGVLLSVCASACAFPDGGPGEQWASAQKQAWMLHPQGPTLVPEGQRSTYENGHVATDALSRDLHVFSEAYVLPRAGAYNLFATTLGAPVPQPHAVDILDVLQMVLWYGPSGGTLERFRALRFNLPVRPLYDPSGRVDTYEARVMVDMDRRCLGVPEDANCVSFSDFGITDPTLDVAVMVIGQGKIWADASFDLERYRLDVIPVGEPLPEDRSLSCQCDDLCTEVGNCCKGCGEAGAQW